MFCLHVMGPMKSLPITSNAALTVVQSSESCSGAGAVTGVALNLSCCHCLTNTTVEGFVVYFLWQLPGKIRACAGSGTLP